MKNILSGLAALAAGFGLCASPASASLIYTLDGGAFTGSFGTVTLTQEGTNKVQVEVDLSKNVGFVNTGAGEPLLFDITGNPAITISNITTGYSAGVTAHGGSIHTGGAGTFEYDILCNTATCGTGGNHPGHGPLVFDVTASGLTVDSFVSDGTAYFAADICRNVASNDTCVEGANTGVEYAAGPGIDPPDAVPEPATALLFSVGLVGLGILRRRAN
jgi:hypothetical protein